jgi:glycosyltransferase involved in cell wall biosynthesis
MTEQDSMTNSGLVIVIPYYKRQFFRQTLECFACQTCKDFRLFVGDDASPESPAHILETFSSRLPITYHRFATNLGYKSLAGHWNRCIAMTDEPWVWLFSDDDLAEPECVEFFLDELRCQPNTADLYRFEKGIIDDTGAERISRIPVPAVESSQEVILARFRDGRSITIPEHVFSRTAFNRIGGFIDFQLAWYSDDASWAAMGRETGIKTIRGPRVFWRTGDFNISGQTSDVSTRTEALVCYLQWLTSHFADENFQTAVFSAVRWWIPRGLRWWAEYLPGWTIWRLWRSFARLTGRPELLFLARTIRYTSFVVHCIRKCRAMSKMYFQRANPRQGGIGR